MKTMDCEEIRELLPLYAGGELDPGERLGAEAHLSFCADCGRELDLYREDRARLAGVREDEPPPGVLDALRKGLEAELFPRKARRPRPAIESMTRFAAAILLGVVIGLVAHDVARRGKPSSPPPSPAAVAPEDAGAGEVVNAGTAAGPLRARNESLGAWPLTIRVEAGPRISVPRAAAEGRHYLPRVESFPPPGEREF